MCDTRKAIALTGVLLASTCALAGSVERALAKSVDVNFVDTPLESAVRYVAKRAGFNVVIDRRELTRDVLRRQVTFRVGGIPAGEAVKWLTRLAGLHYELTRKALLVSSKASIFRKRITLRTYSVHDLTREAADYPGPEIAPEVLGGYAAGGMALMKSHARDDEMSAAYLADMILETVHPDDWTPELGTSIEERGGRLVAMATPEMHDEIAALLDHVRKTRMRMVAFRVRALRVPATAVDSALATASADGTISDEAARLLTAAATKEGGRILASARFTCMNGQRTHSGGGGRKSYVNDFELCADRYDPVVTTLLSGLQADVRPLVSDDGGSILLDLRLGYVDPARTELFEFRPVGPGDLGEGEKETIPTPGSLQQPSVPITSLKTTVSVASGRTVAFAASVPDSDGGGDEEIVFLVTATTVAF